MRSMVALFALAAVAAVGLLFAWFVGSPGFVVIFGVIVGVGLVFGSLELRGARAIRQM